MTECGIIGCHRRATASGALCSAHYVARNHGGLCGVGPEEATCRREQYTERLAGCPLEQWLARRRQTFKTSATTGGMTYSSCGCDCHDQAA